jgi:hypothetical protein
MRFTNLLSLHKKQLPSIIKHNSSSTSTQNKKEQQLNEQTNTTSAAKQDTSQCSAHVAAGNKEV